jgi:hypothetical protein
MIANYLLIVWLLLMDLTVATMIAGKVTATLSIGIHRLEQTFFRACMVYSVRRIRHLFG